MTDLQVYFGMLDALLAEEKIPDEYASQTQVSHSLHFHLTHSVFIYWFIYLFCLFVSLPFCIMVSSSTNATPNDRIFIFSKIKEMIYVYSSTKLLNDLQVILCNDCEKKGASPFHWLYHKCPNCGSYNTRLLWESSFSVKVKMHFSKTGSRYCDNFQLFETTLSL